MESLLSRTASGESFTDAPISKQREKFQVPSCKSSGRGWITLTRTCIFEYGLDIMGLVTTRAIGYADENVNAGELHRTIQRAQFFRLVMQVASHRVAYQTSIFGGVRFKRDCFCFGQSSTKICGISWFCQVEDVFFRSFCTLQKVNQGKCSARFWRIIHHQVEYKEWVDRSQRLSTAWLSKVQNRKKWY